MTATAVANAIRSRFKVEIADEEGIQVVYDNHRNEAVPTDGARWIRFSVLFGDTTLVSVGGIGGRRYRTLGRAIAELYEPAGRGDGYQIQLADAITTAFRGVTLTSPAIVFDAPSLTPGLRDGPWWKRNVSIPFRSDEYA